VHDRFRLDLAFVTGVVTADLFGTQTIWQSRRGLDFAPAPSPPRNITRAPDESMSTTGTIRGGAVATLLNTARQFVPAEEC
jgi:hypothetical protein